MKTRENDKNGKGRGGNSYESKYLRIKRLIRTNKKKEPIFNQKYTNLIQKKQEK